MRRGVLLLLLFAFMTLFLLSCHVRHPSDIRPGMMKGDVIRAWGETYLITHPIRQGKQIEVWEYHFANTGSVCRIVFHEDRVTTTQCWRRPPRAWWY
jgi:hypothetical protein